MSANAPARLNWNGKSLFRPPHQNGSCDSTVPKYHYVPPQAGSPSGAWKSSGHFLDFKIPSQIGTVYALNWRFLLNNTTKNVVNGATVTVPVAAPATPFWLSQIEISVGATLVETIYPHELFNETVGFLPYDQLYAQSDALNLAGADYDSHGSIPIDSSTFFLPFNNCLTTARIYAAGIQEDIKVRVYFPPGLFSGAEVVLSDLTLVVEEDVGSADDAKAWNESHNQGIIYNTLVRQRQNQTVARVAGNTNTIDLTGLNGSSAGLVVYSNDGSQPTPATIADLVERYDITSLTLQDSMGNKKTEVLDGNWLTSFIWPDHIGTAYPVAVRTYLIPFSADFRKATEEGTNCGQVKLDGTDRLVLGPAGATRNESITITNYVYQSLVFAKGKLVSVIKRY